MEMYKHNNNILADLPALLNDVSPTDPKTGVKDYNAGLRFIKRKFPDYRKFDYHYYFYYKHPIINGYDYYLYHHNPDYKVRHLFRIMEK